VKIKTIPNKNIHQLAISYSQEAQEIQIKLPHLCDTPRIIANQILSNKDIVKLLRSSEVSTKKHTWTLKNISQDVWMREVTIELQSKTPPTETVCLTFIRENVADTIGLPCAKPDEKPKDLKVFLKDFLNKTNNQLLVALINFVVKNNHKNTREFQCYLLNARDHKRPSSVHSHLAELLYDSKSNPEKTTATDCLQGCDDYLILDLETIPSN
jgi:uncharacterized protein YozE (UPF0346 family)